jgi:hypothetical protein
VLHESVAEALRRRWPAWILAPEATFSIYGERGAIDILAWHPGRRVVLVIELKTDVVDLNELLGTLDRKRRLARTIASERGLGTDIGRGVADRQRERDQPATCGGARDDARCGTARRAGEHPSMAA